MRLAWDSGELEKAYDTAWTEARIAFGLTMPLITNADGSKFGKSVAGAVWLDPDKTSVYRFYQFWINADDADTPKFTRYFTLLSQEEIETREQELAGNPRELKRLLAEELLPENLVRDDRSR